MNRAKHPTNIFDCDSIINKTSSTKFESFKKVYEEKTGYIKNIKKIDDFYTNQINLSSENKIAEECRNKDLKRLTYKEYYVAEDEDEEDNGKENLRSRIPSKSGTSVEYLTKFKIRYPASLNFLMEKYSTIIPTIKKATILKFKSLKEQNEGN